MAKRRALGRGYQEATPLELAIEAAGGERAIRRPLAKLIRLADYQRPRINLKIAARYGLIMADPAWRFHVRSRETGLGKNADIHYETMPLDDIKAMDVASIAANDCLLWLWCTWPMLKEGIETLEAWGFTYKTGGAWHKRTKHGKTAFGTGYIMRSASEPFLIGTRGAPKTTKGVRNLIDDLAREHSRKPTKAYAAAEALMPQASRIELFSRQSRPGWACWGNETGKFDSCVASTPQNSELSS